MWWITIMMGVSVFGAGAISIVWMRMEISQIAKNCAKLEDQREMVARELHELRGQRSRSLRPSTLAGMVGGRLQMPGRERTVHVSEREMKKRLESYWLQQGSSPALVRMSNIFISPFRFYLVFIAVLVAFTSLGGRLVQLQVTDAEKYKKIALGVRENFITTPARRGDVVDRQGNLLATTRSVVEVGLDPHSIDEEDLEKLPEAARILKLPLTELQDAASRKTRSTKSGELRFVRWVKLKDEVDEKTYRNLQALKIDGIYGNYKHSRLYPNHSLGSHVLGYVNKEGKACMGVEMFADYYLKGQDGWRESERDGRRREMPQYRSFEVLAKDGLNVELSIDRIIQGIAEDELQRVGEEFDPLSASILVTNPKSGEILAMANYPDFDPNQYNESELEHQRNRILTDLYEPGSTFKIVPVAGAMNEGLIEPEDIIDCSDSSYRVGTRSEKVTE